MYIKKVIVSYGKNDLAEFLIPYTMQDCQKSFEYVE